MTLPGFIAGRMLDRRPDATERLVDFAAGLAFALRGSFDKVATKVFLLSPADVEAFEAQALGLVAYELSTNAMKYGENSDDLTIRIDWTVEPRAGADWRTNPATQIRWGLSYIQASYGSPCAAWAHSVATNWY